MARFGHGTWAVLPVVLALGAAACAKDEEPKVVVEHADLSCKPCTADAECGSGACVALDAGPKACLMPCADGCAAGYACAAGGPGAGRCVPASGSCACTAASDGLARACTIANGEGTCVGVESCAAATGWSACSAATPAAETCNGLDDDCDGVVDDGFVDVDGRYTSDRYCGSCAVDCTALSIAGGTGACNPAVDPPVCSVACAGSCLDVNGDPADGCECCDPQPGDLPDASAADANCDGIDGEVTRSIFVATWGADAAAGSVSAPKRTIQAGIDAAFAQGKRDVIVEAGSYEESLNLARGVGVYGGYGSGFARRDPAVYASVIRAPAGTAWGAVNARGVTGGVPASTVLDGFTVYGAVQVAPGAPSYGVYLHDVDATVAITNNRIVAGVGGDGVVGGDAPSATPGAAGDAGIGALDVGSSVCTEASHTPGGAGGATSCSGLQTSGGAGGNRVCPAWDTLASKTAPPLPSEQGTSGRNGSASGGLAGWDVYHLRFQCVGYDSYGLLEGTDGAAGAGGTDGAGGTGCGASLGSVQLPAGSWVPAPAGDGGSGGHGGGGGGGGSGAGAFVHESCFAKGYGYHDVGGSGGGGGAGGCGGSEGTAGTGGGAALGLLVVFDAQPASVPAISGNVLVGGVGGTGGAGGVGAPGGAGGIGGSGGAGGPISENPPDPLYPAFAGGSGGDGGSGGHGGGGGGGCGGPAVGLFAWGQGGADLSAWKASNTWQPGTGGAGGAGGYSFGQRGGAGATGAVGLANF